MIQPHAYQVPIIKNVAKALKRDGKALMVMAPGTGKTYTSAFIAKQIARRSDRILYLCHNNEILRQAAGSYREVLGAKRSMGFFTGEQKADVKTSILFATLQTMRNWKESFGPEWFDIVIVDESHHGQADTFRESIEYFTPRCLLALTATPDREDERDIRDLFGQETVTLTLEEAIAKKYLAPVLYKVMTVGTASREALKRLKSRVSEGARISLRELNDNVFVEHLDGEIAEEIMRYGKQGIIFCSDIQRAGDVAEVLNGARPYHSLLTRKQCEEHLAAFRKRKIRFLVTVDKFNEGIDIPDAELVVFLRSTESRTIFLQQLGRGLRKAPGKHKVIALDFVANAERMSQLSEFAKRIRDYGGDGTLIFPDEFDFDTSGIEFELEEETRDILDILRRIELGFYPTMAEAAAAAVRLAIRSGHEYARRYKEDARLPSSPHHVYATEWRDWSYFLTGKEAIVFYSYTEASAAARKLGIKGEPEYKRRYKEDLHLPSNPNFTYSKEWVSWTRFLRGEDKKSFYHTYAEASAAAGKLGIKSGKQYRKRYSEDSRLPSEPRHVYPSEWIGWKHFLTGESVGFYPTYAEASAAARKLGIKSAKGYTLGYREDPRLPAAPFRVYEDHWKSWPHFLTGKERSLYPTYAEASAAVRKLGIKSVKQYRLEHVRDPKLPFSPHTKYSLDWKGWTHFLRGVQKSFYPTYAEASAAARKLGILTGEEYYRRYKEDPRLPGEPLRHYADSKTWFHFLRGEDKKSFYPTYAEASAAARKLGIKGGAEYNRRYKEDPHLPSNPNIVYSKEWLSWTRFLLGEDKSSFYPTYAEASAAVRKLGVRTNTEYKRRYREDLRLPACPDDMYEDAWQGWPKFLRDKPSFYPTYAEASAAAQKLEIKGEPEYKRRYKEDPHLPSNPNLVYKSKWRSWPHFLGKAKK